LRAKRIFGRLYAARRSSVGQETIAEQLGTFVAQSRYENLPPTVVEKAKRHILDTFGAALAGATSEEAARTMAALSHTEGGGPAPVWGTAEQSSAQNAALLNGIAAHAFELDDTGGCDHSGAVVLPAAVAALSLAQQPVSGRAFITAVVLGYDIGRRALESFGGYRPHNEAGWHSTGTCGTFGAAAAAANLLQLSAAEAKSSLGLAGSFSSGLWAFIHDGAMAKRVHAGRAAEGGLLAALLARAGVTGPAHVFEDVWGGFLKTYAHAETDPGALTRDLGESWRVMRCAIKPYASCRDTHAAVDAVGRILARRALAPEEVAAVHARLSPFVAGMVGGRDASTMPAAQMSLPYAIAARICFGTAGLSAYSPERRADERLRGFIERVAIDLDESVIASDRASVAIVTRNGERIEEPTTTALGAPDNPVADRELLAKYDELASYALPKAQARALADAVMSLEGVPDARELLGLLAHSGANARRREQA
jgi:2-methylcitrate dehydratase PrpD